MVVELCLVPKEPWSESIRAPGETGDTREVLALYPSPRPRYGEEAWRRVFAALGLSARERQLVCRVFRDQRESDMALSLGLSQATIHTYLRRLYRKLSVASRVGLVLRVVAEHQRRGGRSNGIVTKRTPRRANPLFRRKS